MSFHCGHYMCKNHNLFHHPELSPLREDYSLQNGSNVCVCYFMYWEGTVVTDKCNTVYRTAQMCWILYLVFVLRCV